VNRVAEQRLISTLLLESIQPEQVANLFNSLELIKVNGIKDRFINSVPFTIDAVWKRADDILSIADSLQDKSDYSKKSDIAFGVEIDEL